MLTQNHKFQENKLEKLKAEYTIDVTLHDCDDDEAGVTTSSIINSVGFKQ